jgi:hypothetical protein
MYPKFPGSQKKVHPVTHPPEKATAEYSIIARRMQSGLYVLGVRKGLCDPWRFSSFQLGHLSKTDPGAHSPYTALVWASSLFAVDEECRVALDL